LNQEEATPGYASKSFTVIMRHPERKEDILLIYIFSSRYIITN